MDNAFFMKRAIEEAATALKAGEFPVGCVMACDNRVLVTGSRSHSKPDTYNELDHAEMVALRRLADLTTDVDKDKIVVFSTLEPCLMCYSALIVNGITKIVFAFEDVMGGGTGMDLKSLNPLYSNLKIELSSGILRQESLTLLKAFFSDPRNDYLKGTLLAQHTLKA